MEPDLLNGETYDARLEVKGWQMVDFDDRKWKSVQVYPDKPGRKCRYIRARRSKSCRHCLSNRSAIEGGSYMAYKLFKQRVSVLGF
ncbi:alpha-L-rhamnosidase N-terminal domain-containing protein [Dyadobacter pollutisoli]|uniref:alpha-L-rhamnosidase N-terminal domain-containing protein n=1 Tax=Dyadobacter pollutisoli TaxID=2910158 RepID=UPI0035B5C11E